MNTTDALIGHGPSKALGLNNYKTQGSPEVSTSEKTHAIYSLLTLQK